jgi:hypothetical protein
VATHRIMEDVIDMPGGKGEKLRPFTKKIRLR